MLIKPTMRPKLLYVKSAPQMVKKLEYSRNLAAAHSTNVATCTLLDSLLVLKCVVGALRPSLIVQGGCDMHRIQRARRVGQGFAALSCFMLCTGPWRERCPPCGHRWSQNALNVPPCVAIASSALNARKERRWTHTCPAVSEHAAK